jgi:hypothetical protein
LAAALRGSRLRAALTHEIQQLKTMATRRALQVFSLPFLDMVTNYLGATIILFLVAAQYQQEKPCPSIKTQLEGFVDSTGQYIWTKEAAALVTVGDSVLIIIKDTLNLPGQGNSTNGPVVISGGIVYKTAACTLPHCTDNTCPPCPLPGQCAIYATYSDVNCIGTDQFTALVTVKTTGTNCGTTWRSSTGKTGTYNKPELFGPFPISSGKQKITITDVQNSNNSTYIEVMPPSCNNTPTAHRKEPPFYLADIQFVIEFDEQAGNNVGLRVKKDGRTLQLDKNNDIKSIGRITTTVQPKWWEGRKRTKTGIRAALQEQFIPGRYEIQLGGLAGNGPVKTKLYLSSRKHPNTSEYYELIIPQREPQTMFIVEVMADGSLKVNKQ